MIAPVGSAPSSVLVGVAGWSYPDWRGRFYPARADQTPDLARAARLFDCIEINTAFYRYPAPGLAERWLKVVEEIPGFVFTTKVPKELTHDEKLDPAAISGGAGLLLDSLKPLVEAGRLGAVLLQFPFYFRDRPEHRDRIRRLVDAFRPLPAVVEVRHPGFFFGPLREEKPPEESADRPLFTGEGSAIRFFEEIGAGFVNIDLPPSRATPPPTSVNTSAIGYVRLHGRNRKTWFNPKAGRDQKYDYLYSRKELEEWADRVRLLGERTERTFVVLNNHFRGQAPANALLLLNLLQRSTPPPPPELLAAFPELAETLHQRGSA